MIHLGAAARLAVRIGILEPLSRSAGSRREAGPFSASFVCGLQLLVVYVSPDFRSEFNLCTSTRSFREWIMPADALSDDLAALLRMLGNGETATRERPAAPSAVDADDRQQPNPLVERIAAAMLKRIRAG